MPEDKIELRKKLLEGMCKCAERISIFHHLGYDFAQKSFNSNECPKAFKPSVADKFIFNKIIDETIDNIAQEYELLGDLVANLDMIGASLMVTFYYPYYGEWIIPTFDAKKDLENFYLKGV